MMIKYTINPKNLTKKLKFTVARKKLTKYI